MFAGSSYAGDALRHENQQQVIKLLPQVGFEGNQICGIPAARNIERRQYRELIGSCAFRSRTTWRFFNHRGGGAVSKCG
jgi:hypothetical protein